MLRHLATLPTLFGMAAAKNPAKAYHRPLINFAHPPFKVLRIVPIPDGNYIPPTLQGASHIVIPLLLSHVALPAAQLFSPFLAFFQKTFILNQKIYPTE